MSDMSKYMCEVCGKQATVLCLDGVSWAKNGAMCSQPVPPCHVFCDEHEREPYEYWLLAPPSPGWTPEIAAQ